MAEQIAKIKLQILAGKANPAPPVGPALGQHGVQIMDFCRKFNAKTKDQPGMVIPVEITVFRDKSFTFITKTPTCSILIKKALGIEKGSAEPNKVKVGVLKKEKLEEIAKIKMPDLNANTIEAAMKIVAGSARSMGITVEN